MIKSFKPRFVEFMPETLDQGVLYVSMRYRTASHLCACGCEAVVVTPLNRSGWTLTYDGTVSLSPSIGNWSMECKSHYWIKQDAVQWAPQWSTEEIAAGRRRDHMSKPQTAPNAQTMPKRKVGIWERIANWFSI